MTIRGEDIKKYRDNNNLSQTEMAERIGVSTRTIQNYEAGNTIPKSKQSLLQDIIHRDPDNENTDNKDHCNENANGKNNVNKDAGNENAGVTCEPQDKIMSCKTKSKKNKDNDYSAEYRARFIEAIHKMAEAMKTASEASNRNSKTFETFTNHLINCKELTIHEVNKIISKLNDQDH
jgi:DNA-binding transcriptional regulator YiaG